ncbi:MAG: hypothetical protein R2737_15355 [Candidatus Nanopelagicales bacterium]
MTVHARGRVRRWGTRAVVAAAVVGLASVGLPGAAQAGGPGNWTQLSKNAASGGYPKMVNIDQPTLLRLGDGLQVVWRGENTTSSDSYRTAIVSTSGATTTPETTILTWATLNDAPALASIGGTRWLGFGGLYNDDANHPYSQGQGYYLTSSDGVNWTLGDGTLSSSGAYATSGLDIVDDGGQPLWVSNQWGTADGSAAQGIGFRIGVDPRVPIPGDEPDEFIGLPGCCAYAAAAARDTVTGQVFGGWYSNADVTRGVYVAQVAPSAGDPVLAPFSRASGTNSLDPGQRLAMVARNGGGVYVVYRVGYPSTSYLALWKVGTTRVLRVPGSRNAEFPSVSTGPGGRLWVSWVDRTGTDTVKAVRTNTSATRFGAVVGLRGPRLTDPIWHQVGDGAAGPLDVVVTASRGQAINVYHSQLRPGLTVTVKPVKVPKRKSFVVSVTDAGSAVAGAKVKVFGKTFTTNAKGLVGLSVPFSAKKGANPITVTKSGYAGAKASVRVI